MLQTVQGIFGLRRNGYSGPFFMGLMLFAVGVSLLLPYDTFSTAESYDVMEDWASEIGWGVFMVAASGHIVIASLRRQPEFVALGALTAAFGWLVTTVSVGLANPEGLLFPIVGILCLRAVSIHNEFKARKNDPHLLGDH